MTVWTVILMMIITGDRLDLQPVPHVFKRSRSLPASVGSEQTFIVGGEGKVFHWDQKGRLIRTIEIDGEVRFCAYLTDFYVITVEQAQLQTLYFDAHGTPLKVAPQSKAEVVYDLNQVGDLFFTPQLDFDYVKKNNYVFLANQIQFLKGSDGITVKRPGFSLAKASERMHELFFNFKKIFLVRAHPGSHPTSNLMLSVNQLENRVYFYDAETIRRENVEGERMGTKIPFLTLNLADYHPPPNTFFQPELMIFEEKAQTAFDAWWNELGLIRYFDSTHSGYVIVYEIPTYIEGRCVDFDVIMQLLDKDFGPIGAYTRLSGPPIGLIELDDRQNLAVFQVPEPLEGRQDLSIFLYPVQAH